MRWTIPGGMPVPGSCWPHQGAAGIHRTAADASSSVLTASYALGPTAVPPRAGGPGRAGRRVRAGIRRRRAPPRRRRPGVRGPWPIVSLLLPGVPGIPKLEWARTQKGWRGTTQTREGPGMTRLTLRYTSARTVTSATPGLPMRASPCPQNWSTRPCPESSVPQPRPRWCQPGRATTGVHRRWLTAQGLEPASSCRGGQGRELGCWEGALGELDHGWVTRPRSRRLARW
jgi:hypothetical protein